MKLCHVAVFAASISVACNPFARPVVNDYEANAYALQVVREGLAAYHDTAGRYPDSLIQICPSLDGARCHWLPFGYRLEDRWDRPLRYVRRGDEYEVGSTGRDGRYGTADDVLFRPSTEREFVNRVTGCYALRLPWWPEFPGDELRLDTATKGIGSFVAWPNAAPFSGVVWEPIGADSLAVRWYSIHHSRHLRFHAGSDSLVGYSAVGGGMASWRGATETRHAVVARRRPCRDRAG